MTNPQKMLKCQMLFQRRGMLFKQRPTCCSSIGYGVTLLLEQTSSFWKNTPYNFWKQISKENIKGFGRNKGISMDLVWDLY